MAAISAGKRQKGQGEINGYFREDHTAFADLCCSIVDCTHIGQSQFLTPVAAKPLSFSLALDDHSHDNDHAIHAQYGHGLALSTDDDNESTTTARLEDSDARLMEMLAAQAAHREVDSLDADEEAIAMDEKMVEDRKKEILQRSLNIAASNGDVERVKKLVQGKAKDYVDVNISDEEGTVPLIYASCFVCLFSVFDSGISQLTLGRDTKMLLQHSLMQVPMLISKIETNGVH